MMDSAAALRAVVAREKDKENANGALQGGGRGGREGLTLGRVVVTTAAHAAHIHVYELFDAATGRLLVACATDGVDVKEAAFFSTLPGLGQVARRYADLPTSPLAAAHLGTLRRAAWGGLRWSLVAGDGETELCEVRFAMALLAAAPVRFALSMPLPLRGGEGGGKVRVVTGLCALLEAT